MKKVMSALMILIMFVCCFCSCADKNNSGKNEQNYAAVTAKSTAVYNHFKDRIPELKFKNTPVEKYEDGLSYVLSVKCSEKEYKSCIKKLKKAGFDVSPVETDTYYNASDDTGYFVEVTYVGEMLTVYIATA